MGVAKKGRGNNFQNCSTSSKVLYGCQLVILGEKSFLARSATIIPFGPLLLNLHLNLFGGRGKDLVVILVVTLICKDCSRSVRRLNGRLALFNV